MPGCVGCRFRAVGGACFGEDAGDVVGHGAEAYDQFFGDLPVVPAQGQDRRTSTSRWVSPAG